MNVPDDGLFSTEELSVEKTITGEVSSQGDDTKPVLKEVAGSHANAPPLEWLITIMNDEAESSSTRASQPKVPKIPKISQMIRDIGSNTDCYDPLVVSIGPYHHGKPELREMEELKIIMAKRYVKECKEKSIQALYMKVEEVAGEAKKYYEFDSSSAIDDQSFTKMMFLDGCFLLQYIYSSVLGQQYMGIKNHQLSFVQRDLFLLENQLPYIVLKALMSIRFKDDDEGKKMIDKFIYLCLPNYYSPPQLRRKLFVWLFDIIIYTFPAGKPAGPAPKRPPHSRIIDLHLLDIMRKQFAGPHAIVDDDKRFIFVESNWSERYKSAKELKTTGIRFWTNNSGHCSDVKFVPTMLLYGALTLPPLRIDGSTKSMLLNMVAFETYTYDPDAFWVTSYICFMDSLINHAEDVTVLKSQNILHNYLGSDQEVADLFNGIAKYLEPNPLAYVRVRNGIRKYHKFRFKIALGR